MAQQKKDDVMMSVIGTLLVSLEIFAVAFVVFQVITEGGWWLVGLITYFFWLLYIGTFKGAVWNIGTGLILAVSYMLGGIVASIVAYVVLLIFGEIFMKSPKDESEN